MLRTGLEVLRHDWRYFTSFIWGSLATRTAHRLKAMGRRIPEVNLRTLNQQNQEVPQPSKSRNPCSKAYGAVAYWTYTKGAHRA